jgi:hypothetical protein
MGAGKEITLNEKYEFWAGHDHDVFNVSNGDKLLLERLPQRTVYGNYSIS